MIERVIYMKKKNQKFYFSFSDILFVLLSAVFFMAAQAAVVTLLQINEIISALFFCSLFSAAVLTYVFYRRGAQLRGDAKPTAEISSVLSEALLSSPNPVLVCSSSSSKILWMNKTAADIAGGKHNSRFESIFEREQTGNDALSIGPEDKALYHAGERMYKCRLNTAYGNDDVLYRVYTMVDITEREETERALKGKECAVAYIVVDNLEELLNYEQEDYRSASGETDRLLRQWAAEAGGTIKEYQQEKYIFFFAQSHLPVFEKQGFDILDKIRNIRIGENSISLTVSIGVSNHGETVAEKEKNARSALDTALQRGGDQAVVKGDGTLDIYGGKTKMAQKRTKVKARTIANELVSHITSSDNVIIMFHKFADFDAFGSAVGIARLAMFCGVPVNIVMSKGDSGIEKCYNRIKDEKDYKGVFVDSATALDMVTSNTLLIICDVCNKRQFECPELCDSCKNIVIIDHHRKTADFDFQPIITYIEPAASAASELVCEMLEQVLPAECLLQKEAELMLTGILLDTNQFTKSTGTRTFSAALYLRSVGADVGEVQEFFKTDLNDFQREQRFHSNVEIYRNICAIATAVGPCEIKDKIPAAKAANRLLTVEGVKASFTIVPIDNEIHISARSSGTINVQLILEGLRGGGHFDAAGTRLEGAGVDEAVAMLKAAIDKYLDDFKK